MDSSFSLLDKVGAEWQRMLGIAVSKLITWDQQHHEDVTMAIYYVYGGGRKGGILWGIGKLYQKFTNSSKISTGMSV